MPTPTVNQILLYDIFHKNHPSHQVCVCLPTELQPRCFDDRANFSPGFCIYLETDFRRLHHHIILLSHTLLLLLSPKSSAAALPQILLKLLPALLSSLVLFSDCSRWQFSVCFLLAHSSPSPYVWYYWGGLGTTAGQRNSLQNTDLAEESYGIHIYNIQTTSATFVLSSCVSSPWQMLSAPGWVPKIPGGASARDKGSPTCPGTAKATWKRAEKLFLFCVAVTRTDTKAGAVWKEPCGTHGTGKVKGCLGLV